MGGDWVLDADGNIAAKRSVLRLVEDACKSINEGWVAGRCEESADCASGVLGACSSGSNDGEVWLALDSGGDSYESCSVNDALEVSVNTEASSKRRKKIKEEVNVLEISNNSFVGQIASWVKGVAVGIGLGESSVSGVISLELVSSARALNADGGLSLSLNLLVTLRSGEVEFNCGLVIMGGEVSAHERISQKVLGSFLSSK